MIADRDYEFLLDKIKRNRNIDLSQYRRAVLKRRIQHRLFVVKCDTYMDYVMLLNQDPNEYDLLIETLTIKVSEFFRDSQVFDILGAKVIPEIVSVKQARGVNRIRAWSCGAAYGEEAYSTAILFCEVLGRSLDRFNIEILATDIDKSALQRAPWGAYDKRSLRSVSPHLLFKYFTRVGDRYVISDKARSIIRFRYHDIVSDNTLSGMDLIQCKNLLIYFEKELQDKVVHKLHAALNPDGFLVLGNTESIAFEMRDYFEVVDLARRIYKKRSAATNPVYRERRAR
jgi:chemotaxis methyl-accepting protein methylase